MNDLLSFWDSIGRPKILVLGDIILDQYVWGDAERVSPEAPVLVLKVDTHEARLGGEASVACLLAALDAEVTLAGVIGDDANGRVVSRLLDEAGIDASLVHCDGPRPTTNKARFIGRADGKHPHHILRVDEEWGDLLTAEVQNRLAEQILDRLAGFDAVLISDYAKGVCRSTTAKTTWRLVWHEPPGSCETSGETPTTDDDVRADSEDVAPQHANRFSMLNPSWSRVEIPSPHPSPRKAGAREPEAAPTVENEPDETILLKTVIQAANELGIPVLVDPARIKEVECYRGATLLKPNRVEAELSAGFKIDSPEAAMRAGESFCEKLGLQAAVITLDRDGMVLSRRDVQSELFPATPRAVCDITGAGDMAFVMLGLVIANTARASPEGFHTAIPSAVQLANIASGLEVERLGVTPVDRGEIRAEILQSMCGHSPKLTNLDEMQRLADKHRRDGKTIVFTNGCFDLLHVGHLTCLKEAARLGDVLVVAISSDENVRRLKGADRPVIGQAERAAMLAGLECVDHVLIFDEPTPHELLRRLRPDVLAKGQTTPDVVGREIVEAYGGQVRTVGFVEGVSTTNLIERTCSIAPSKVLNAR